MCSLLPSSTNPHHRQFYQLVYNYPFFFLHNINWRCASFLCLLPEIMLSGREESPQALSLGSRLQSMVPPSFPCPRRFVLALLRFAAAIIRLPPLSFWRSQRYSSLFLDRRQSDFSSLPLVARVCSTSSRLSRFYLPPLPQRTRVPRPPDGEELLCPGP